jgi:hypothetical protein
MATSLPDHWQKIDAHRHICHSWQISNARMIAAMATIAIILAFIALLVVRTVYAVRRDDRGDLPSPGSRFEDPAFLPPARRR